MELSQLYISLHEVKPITRDFKLPEVTRKLESALEEVNEVERKLLTEDDPLKLRPEFKKKLRRSLRVNCRGNLILKEEAPLINKVNSLRIVTPLLTVLPKLTPYLGNQDDFI